MSHPEGWPAMRLGNGRHMIESLPLVPTHAPG
jgi:hypothetical protein